MYQTTLTFQTENRGHKNITNVISEAIKNYAPQIGLCHLFIQHTSASLIIGENADPDVMTDLENYMTRLVKDGDPFFKHRAEGEDDMSAHIRTVLTETSLIIPITNHQLALGKWQGIYLWEHRCGKYQRKVVVTVV
jgi:secondary thiamine-phosphate synthase enzyme